MRVVHGDARGGRHRELVRVRVGEVEAGDLRDGVDEAGRLVRSPVPPLRGLTDGPRGVPLHGELQVRPIVVGRRHRERARLTRNPTRRAARSAARSRSRRRKSRPPTGVVRRHIS